MKLISKTLRIKKQRIETVALPKEKPSFKKAKELDGKNLAYPRTESNVQTPPKPAIEFARYKQTIDFWVKANEKKTSMKIKQEIPRKNLDWQENLIKKDP